MPQSLAKILVHLVFSTKHRERVLTNDIREELHSYLAGILKNYESPAVLINSVEDHVHILFSQSRNHSLADLVEEVKKGSSKWLKTKGSAFARFHWQNGYGAFSVSQSNAKQVTEYIENQPEHHRRNRSRTSSSPSSNGTKSSTMNGMCGIEPLRHSYFAPSGRGRFAYANPGRCPGLYYLAPSGQTYPAPLDWATSLRSLRSFAAKTK